REETQLARALRERERIVSAQLDPPLGANLAGLVESARALKDSGQVGFVDGNANARSRGAMSAGVASAAIARACGSETIPHRTPGGLTVMGLESAWFGASAEGVRNMLAVTGDPPEVGDYPGSRAVYEVDSIGLTRLMQRLNRGEDANGRPIDAPTSFFVGVAVNPSADDLELELDRFHQKLEAGAAYAMTQLVFHLQYLHPLLKRPRRARPLAPPPPPPPPPRPPPAGR